MATITLIQVIMGSEAGAWSAFSSMSVLCYMAFAVRGEA
jgi:hypothetical protein